MNPMSNPEQTVFRTAPDFRGPLLELVSQVQPGGHLYYWLRQQGDLPGAIVIPTDGSRVLLVRQHRVASGRFHLQFPRGYAELTDTDGASVALRELHEETGLVGVASTHLGEIYADPGILSASAEVYSVLVTGQDLDQVASGGLTDEADVEGISSYHAVTFPQVREAIARGELDDGLTLAAWSLFAAQEVQW